MPFTPSHAVVALPFIRTPLVPAAIAVGAMTPDLPLFVRAVVPTYSTTHDFAAIAITVAMALGLLLVWRLLLRPAARVLAPAPIAERLPPSWQRGSRATLKETFVGDRGAVAQTMLLLVSLAIGIASHILWDSGPSPSPRDDLRRETERGGDGGAERCARDRDRGDALT